MTEHYAHVDVGFMQNEFAKYKKNTKNQGAQQAGENSVKNSVKNGVKALFKLYADPGKPHK